MLKAAGYPRYSDIAQSETSIDDQIRQIRKLASTEGLTIPDEMIFPDYAVQGTSTVGRQGFQRLMDAWDAKKVDIIFVDEMSRLARDLATGGALMQKVEKTGVIIVSRDGLDTRRDGWQMQWSFMLVIASQEVRTIGPRVIRGMQGQLERGHMIACPPIGYRALEVKSIHVRERGTSWVIEEVGAALIREIFAMRFSGKSLAKIATALNKRRVPLPRAARDGNEPFWRPGSIFRLLGNRIYRGVFVANDSAPSRAKATAERREREVIEYPRPDLRLVSDELWYACNPTDRVVRVRGGGKHIFAGLVQCGDCKGLLTVGGGPKSFGLYCAECDQRKRFNGDTSRMGYTSVAAASTALYAALEQLFTGSVMDEFQEKLRKRLTAGPVLETTSLKEKLAQLNAARARASRMLSNPDIDESLFIDEVTRMSEEHKRIKTRLEQLEALEVNVTAEVIERQCAIAPLPLLASMLKGESGLESYNVRATLKRLLRKFVFVKRPARYVSVFEITFIPGAHAAELTDTGLVDKEEVTFEVTSRTSAKRPVVWDVGIRRI